MTKQELTERKKYLKRIISRLENELTNAPEGKLRFSRRGRDGYTCYFCCTEPGDTTGKYIKKRDRSLAAALAQKDYNIRVAKAANKELTLIDNLMKYDSVQKAEQVYSALEEPRRTLIRPVWLPDDQYAEEWLKRDYDRKSFSEDIPEYYTNNGIRVRSKSEILIADSLERNHIPFLYECPLYIKGLGEIHPDFTVLNLKERKEYIWEHLGMMDDPGYAENALERLEKYMLDGYFLGKQLIISYETSTHPINTRLINKLIRTYLL